ncbi:hypothetical protein TCAL_13381, partial [Tigriopus californicus]
LTIVDLEQGLLVPASIQGFSSLQIPPLPRSKLQTQKGDTLIVCMEVTKKCQKWKPSVDEWTPMASLHREHKAGCMSLFSGQPIVIGGRDQAGLHGVVEIFDEQTHEWIIGPTIPVWEHERPLSVIKVNQSTIVVVGGNLRSMNILHKQDMIWHPLANYPMQRWLLVCGLLDTDLILCIGGRDFYNRNQSSAYGLNLA